MDCEDGAQVPSAWGRVPSGTETDAREAVADHERTRFPGGVGRGVRSPAGGEPWAGREDDFLNICKAAL